LQVIATTTIVGDILRQVGGDRIALTVLTPLGADPHTFEPRPQDIALLSEAQLVFINGLGLEEALMPIVDSSAAGSLIDLSDGIQPLTLQAEIGDAGDETHAGGDPHTWTDPQNVEIWAGNAAKALSAADPDGAAYYRANADELIAELQALDAWIQEQVALIPEVNRKLVSDHAIFGYFAHRYGLQQAGLIMASFSTNAASSAQELAALEDVIASENVPAIFVSKGTNAALAEQIGRDTGVSVVYVYSGSLGEPGGEADTYLKYMRYNVAAIVAALKQ
jgi:ABC-type Zn uptake system ZnuABC Zn-binding protein ZnuA